MCACRRRIVLAECASKVRRAKGIKKSLALELRLMRDKDIKAQYEGTVQELERRFAVIEADIESAQRTDDRNQLFGGNGGEVKGNDDYLSAADHIQDQTEESLGRTLKLVEASKEVGQSTLDEMNRQQSRMMSISDDVMRIEDNLTRADRLIRNFTKRMMTDKLIQLFAFVNFLALLIVACRCLCGVSPSRLYVCGILYSEDPKKENAGAGHTPARCDTTLKLTKKKTHTNACQPPKTLLLRTEERKKERRV